MVMLLSDPRRGMDVASSTLVRVEHASRWMLMLATRGNRYECGLVTDILPDWSEKPVEPRGRCIATAPVVRDLHEVQVASQAILLRESPCTL
jgi:hypothetical protein